MERHYLTVAEAAARLRVHERTVRRYIRESRLTKYTIATPRSHRVRVDAAEVEQLVQTQAPEVTGV